MEKEVIESLIEKVWANPRLVEGLQSLERLWIARAASIDESEHISPIAANRYVEAAAILACSVRSDQRLVAYRLATYVHELFAKEVSGLDAAVRAVLTRLGNFPSLSTSASVSNALPSTPWVIAQEEILRRRENEISIGDKSLALTDFQKKLWNNLSAGNSIAISAPTSTGKSFVLQSFISNQYAARSNFCACYVVPTRALITQVQADLAVAFAAAGVRDVEIVSVPPEIDEALPSKVVFVFTQERLQILFANDENLTIDFLVVDEAHSLQDGGRGVLLQGVIDEAITRKPDVQLLFASPTVSNLNVFSQVTGRKDIQPESTDEASVSQNFIEVAVTGSKQGEVVLYARDGDVRNEVGKVRLGQTIASRVDGLVHLSHRFGAGKQSIVFADGQADAEKIALQLHDLRKAEDGLIESGPLKELSNLAKEAVHQKYVLAATVLTGVGFHYGNIPTILRNAVEKAFSDGHLRYLVCTSTLLAGVNLPAQNIFMYTPQRKKGVPLESIDFWNLAGRAGRLRREFQGNIYLLNYQEWESKPLAGPRVSEIIPAMQDAISLRTDELATVIDGSSSVSSRSGGELETTFVRLLSDYKSGRIINTLDRAYQSDHPASREVLEGVLARASELIGIPSEILKFSPTVSAHRQQKLYENLLSVVQSEGDAGARALIPAHPRERGAFESYMRILKRLHETVLPKANSEKQNRFFSTMILKWMQGTPLPELIDDRARFQQAAMPTHIRATLDLVEKELRFNYVRAFGCYAALLSYVLRSEGLESLTASIPSLSLYLEIGASDKTMVSFVAMGLSRMTAKRLNSLCPNKSLNVADARKWLASQDLDFFGFSSHIRREIDIILSAQKTSA